MDFFHQFQTYLLEKYHNYMYRDSVLKPPFQDNYIFDLGYHQSYSLVIFLNCLIFSFIAPMISFFASLFFYIKYNVDKYNLIFVYYKVFESGGKIRKVVNDYMLLNLTLYFIIIISFFTIRFNKD